MVSTPATGKDREYPVYFCPTEDLTIFFFINKIRLCSRLFLVPWTEKLRIWLNDNNCDMPHLNSIKMAARPPNSTPGNFLKLLSIYNWTIKGRQIRVVFAPKILPRLPRFMIIVQYLFIFRLSIASYMLLIATKFKRYVQLKRVFKRSLLETKTWLSKCQTKVS